MNIIDELGEAKVKEIIAWRKQHRIGFTAAARHFGIAPYQARAVYELDAKSYNAETIGITRSAYIRKFAQYNDISVRRDGYQEDSYVVDAMARLLEERGK